MNVGTLYKVEVNGEAFYFKNMRRASTFIWEQLIIKKQKKALLFRQQGNNVSKFVLMQTYHAEGNPLKD